MQFNTFVTSEADILECKQSQYCKEVLIEPAFCAREGKLSIQEVTELNLFARSLELKTVLVWDILMTETVFQKVILDLQKLDLANFSAIRFQCVGAGEWLKNNYPEIKLQFIAETGNNNLPAITTWVNYFGKKLERIVLSLQLPEEKIIEYIKKLPIQCEILGVGKILLFYSPRSLLAPNFSNQSDDENTWIEVESLSDESHNRAYPTIESNHGTFMYLDKDQFILDKLDELEKAGIHIIRLDLRHLSEKPNSAIGINNLINKIIEKDPDLKQNWPRKTLAPFFKSNKTTKQFKRLKTKTRVLRDDNCFAEVVSIEKPQIIALFTLKEFSLFDEFNIALTSGEILECTLSDFKDLDGKKITKARKNQIITSSWIKNVTPGSLLIKKTKIENYDQQATII